MVTRGFIDADGCFFIRYTEGSMNLQNGRKTKKRIAVIFKMEQQKNHKKTGCFFEPFIKRIAHFLTVRAPFENI